VITRRALTFAGVALALGACALVVFATPTPAGFGVIRMTQEAAVEYCRAEVTRGFLVKYQATGHRDFKSCMAAQGY
jgi:hypothetical protein